MTRPTYPTAFDAVNRLVDVLHTGIRQALGDTFSGLFLLGSLATGDYDPLSSDIDFLVATRVRIDDGQFHALAHMHAALRESGMPGATNIEGVYIPLVNLRAYRAADAHPWLGCDGHFAWETQHCDWIIQRHIAREQAVIVVGPDPHTLIDPVSPDALKQATRALLHEWWTWQIDDHRNLVDDEYQAYAVLTMCRARYTLATGAIASKPAAARWLSVREPQHAPVIAHALAWRPGARMAALSATVDLLRATLTIAEA